MSSNTSSSSNPGSPTRYEDRCHASSEALVFLADRLGVSIEELWTGKAADWAVEMAEDLRARGLPREAYNLLERTLTNLERDGHVPTRVLAVMYRELGLAEREIDPEGAERHLRQAVEAGKDGGTPAADRAAALAALGDCLSDRGNLEEALDAHRQASHLLLGSLARPRTSVNA